MLAFIPNPSNDEVQEFTAAAGDGSIDKVRVFNEALYVFMSHTLMDRVASRA